jgi:hypothetical protein
MVICDDFEEEFFAKMRIQRRWIQVGNLSRFIRSGDFAAISGIGILPIVMPPLLRRTDEK